MNEDQIPPEAPSPNTSADNTVKNHMYGSMAVGLIPMPMVDLVALTGIQLNMLRKLAKIYDIPFMQDKVKHLISSLLGSSLPLVFSGTLASLLKTLPIVGQTTGVLALPALAGATTYAIGKIFTQHFASGGTFLTFDPEAVREHFQQLLKEGKEVSATMKPPVEAEITAASSEVQATGSEAKAVTSEVKPPVTDAKPSPWKPSTT